MKCDLFVVLFFYIKVMGTKHSAAAQLNILQLSVLIKREKHAIPIEKYASLFIFFYKIKKRFGWNIA